MNKDKNTDMSMKNTMMSSPSKSKEFIEIRALVELLIENGVISAHEYNSKLDEINERFCGGLIRYSMDYLEER